MRYLSRSQRSAMACVLTWASLVYIAPAQAALLPDASINISFPSKSTPLNVEITREHSKVYGWRAGQIISLRITVGTAGEGEALRDAAGHDRWQIRLDETAQGRAVIDLGEEARSGRIRIWANGKELPSEPHPATLEPSGRFIEKVHEYQFDDGARILVHYTDEDLLRADADPELPSSVLDAAVMAYQTITQFQGFNSKGYTFASPDKSFAYDPDRTIDIFLGNPAGDSRFAFLGEKNRLFKDAPCFDTISLGGASYEAVILLPANYREFIRGWERINPSPLGKRNLHVDLRGTLIHEMLHTILFYYNKNLNKSLGAAEHAQGHSEGHLDWYVEGLARYFETFAGARHDFYSQGFKETLPDKIRFSRGGSNYFMRYPDQSFMELRYENALFWRFMDHRYGMSAIEELSRSFRDLSRASFRRELERVTGANFEDLLTQFAASVELADLGLKEDTAYLNPVARTRLEWDGRQWLLGAGEGPHEALGRRVSTDWIGSWETFRAPRSQGAVAGDGTDRADVSAWASDYIEIRFGPNAMTPRIHLKHLGTGAPLVAQWHLYSRGGSVARAEARPIEAGSERDLGLIGLLQENGWTSADIERAVLILTNTDPAISAEYEIAA